MYRSFITCDDPKGVVDCSTVRKSNSQKMEPKRESRRKLKKSSSSLDYHKPEEEKILTSKRVAEDLIQNPSSFQLNEVSKGAQQLNQIIESCSKGMRSNDIAKDLLKGALDLQDSLVMLSKLQEASHYMTQMKKKQIQKLESGKKDELRSERRDSNQYKDKYLATDYQKHSLSADGSSRNCTDELKNVIRESLVRQSLFRNGSAYETSSSSSSQSSTFNVTTNSTIESTTTQMTKSPNLFFKLMGLEEYPSKPLQVGPQKQFEGKKISKPQRPVFEIDMPIARKPQALVHRTCQESTLKEILEAMQFKGLLKSNSSKRLQSYPHNSKDSPPIVLIRPLRVPHLESKELYIPVHQQDGDLNRKKFLRKLKVKEELCPKTMSHSEGHLKFDKVLRKQDAEEKEIVTKEEFPNKSRPYHNPQANKAIEKEAEKIKKVSTASRKKLEKETVKTKNVEKSQDQAKMSSQKAGKPESNITKNQASRQPSSKPSTVMNHATQSARSNYIGQKKNHIKKEKPTKVTASTKPDVENGEHEKDDDKKMINLTIDNDYRPVRTETDVECEPHKVEGADTTRPQIGKNSNNMESCLSDASKTAEEITDCLSSITTEAEEITDCLSSSTTEVKTFKKGENLKALLMSSPSFLHHAEELFNINTNISDILQTYSLNDFGTSSMRLYTDCAKELTERRSSQHSQAVHPLLLISAGNARLCIDFEKLVEEVLNWIETLVNYIDGEGPFGDSLYAILERDMICGGVVNGIWDSSWRYEFSIDEAEQVVTDIVKQVLSGLIEEVIA